MAAGAADAAPDGKELFRELLSVYPSACYEDYYKPPGVWNIETLEIDLELLHAHRKEAGAPEPTPLDEVEMPELPKSNPGLAAAQAAAEARARAGPPGKPMSSVLKPTVVAPGQVGVVRKPLVVPARAGSAVSGPARLPAAAGTSPGEAAGPSAELKQIALFIQRWKLEATKAKLLLARLTPTRRRWVMSNYRGVSTLEAYIQTCDRTNAWATGGAAADTAPAAARPTLATARAAYGQAEGGVKRPLIASAAAGESWEAEPTASKMPRSAASAPSITPARVGPKPPGGAPPAGLLRAAAKPTAVARAPTDRYGSSAAADAPSWAAKPGTYGSASSGIRPAAKLLASAKPSAVRPAAAKPASAGAAYGRPAGYGQAAPAKAGIIRPAAPRPGAAMAGYTRPTAKVGPAKAKAPEKPGSLIKSLLKHV